MQLDVVDSRIVDVGWLRRNRSLIRHEGWLCRGWSVVAGCLGNGCGAVGSWLSRGWKDG